MLNDRQLYSVKQLLDFFKNMPILREREMERWNVRVLIICICLSVPTKQWTVNFSPTSKHVVAEKYNRFSMETILLQ